MFPGNDIVMKLSTDSEETGYTDFKRISRICSLIKTPFPWNPSFLRLAFVLLLIPSAAAQAQTSQPHMSNPTLVTVGNVNITRSMIDAHEVRLPPTLSSEQRQEARTGLLQEMIFEILVKEYLRANNVQHTGEDLAEVQRRREQRAQQNVTPRRNPLKKEDIENWARSVRLQRETASPEKIAAVIKAHPDYFDGTKVCASHILIPCRPLASTRKQKAAKKKLRRIQMDIRAGQITFADAARQYSACPSKEKGGDLGEFAFDDMVPPFARAAFDAKVGDVTDIVRTKFGFHLIHVTARSEGTGKPGPQVRALAKRLLLAELQNRIFDQALTTVPIVVSENAAATTQKNTTPKKTN